MMLRGHISYIKRADFDSVIASVKSQRCPQLGHHLVREARPLETLALSSMVKVDWVAFGNTSYSASLAIMQHLAGWPEFNQ